MPRVLSAPYIRLINVTKIPSPKTPDIMFHVREGSVN
jgi:hypothetical protein